jgi:hypothetical protein
MPIFPSALQSIGKVLVEDVKLNAPDAKVYRRRKQSILNLQKLPEFFI